MSISSSNNRVFLSAFGIHSGGGFVLLKALMSSLLRESTFATLDARLPVELIKDFEGRNKLIPRRFVARIRSVNDLARRCDFGDILFCFNGLPPLRKSRGFVVVYIQSANLVGIHSGVDYDLSSRLRFMLERLWLRFGCNNVDEYWVQTPLMHKKLASFLPSAKIRVIPFIDNELAKTLDVHSEVFIQPTLYDASYFYPADGVPHKNHIVLLSAWEILAEKHGVLCPKLLLTLTSDCWARLSGIANLSKAIPYVINLGCLKREQVMRQIEVCDALIFPSRVESFGLPLLEAAALKKPIIASELDFVRDICVPSQTFNPESPLSIALAVERHLGVKQNFGGYFTAAEIVRKLLMCANLKKCNQSIDP